MQHHRSPTSIATSYGATNGNPVHTAAYTYNAPGRKSSQTELGDASNYPPDLDLDQFGRETRHNHNL